MRRQLLREGMSIIFVLLLAMAFVPVVNAEIADHVVISEVYVNAAGSTESDNEWVELYNPTASEVNISGWKIDTATYQPDATLPAGVKIPPYGFYLIGDKGWTPDNSSWPTPDYHNEEITLTNTDGWIQLKDSTGAVIDTVGWGSATVNETLAYPDNPPQNQSLERKTNATTIDHNYGNAWDSDDNSADFLIQDSPNPQNSTWISEPGHKPLPPVPELPSIILFAVGLITLAGYVLYTKKK
jgi:hypothetical protein